MIGEDNSVDVLRALSQIREGIDALMAALSVGGSKVVHPVNPKPWRKMSRAEKEELRSEFMSMASAHQSLTSFEAQSILGKNSQVWTSKVIRYFLSELVEQGKATKTGTKRSMKYTMNDGCGAPR